MYTKNQLDIRKQYPKIIQNLKQPWQKVSTENKSMPCYLKEKFEAAHFNWHLYTRKPFYSYS